MSDKYYTVISKKLNGVETRSVYFDIGDIVSFDGEPDFQGDVLAVRKSDGFDQYIWIGSLQEIIDAEFTVIEEDVIANQKYILVSPVTLRGKPAGPELGGRYPDYHDDTEYLSFIAGDIVTKDPSSFDADGVVTVTDGEDWQELDESSLRRVWNKFSDVPEDVIVKDGFSYWRKSDGVVYMDWNGIQSGSIAWDDGALLHTDSHDWLDDYGYPYVEVIL